MDEIAALPVVLSAPFVCFRCPTSRAGRDAPLSFLPGSFAVPDDKRYRKRPLSMPLNATLGAKIPVVLEFAQRL